jgi:hypothetical protein
MSKRAMVCSGSCDMLACVPLCACRATGAPGVVGSSPSAEEVDVDEEGHIEVACTAHTNTGVRSLVKSVIRGLKVCTAGQAAAASVQVASASSCGRSGSAAAQHALSIE